MALSDSFKTSLAKTILGVKQANGGLTVDGLKKGLTRLNDTSRKDTKMYYQPAFRQTRRLQNKRKVTTLKKDDLLKMAITPKNALDVRKGKVAVEDGLVAEMVKEGAETLL